MKQVTLSMPELGLIVGTRAALGAGFALLLGDRFDPEQRRTIGWTLLAVGIATTIPLAARVFRQCHASSNPDEACAPNLSRTSARIAPGAGAEE